MPLWSNIVRVRVKVSGSNYQKCCCKYFDINWQDCGEGCFLSAANSTSQLAAITDRLFKILIPYDDDEMLF